MNRTRADAIRTHAVSPLSMTALSPAQAGADTASTIASAAGNSKARRRRAVTTLSCIYPFPPDFVRRRTLRVCVPNFRASAMASQCAIESVAHQRNNRSQGLMRVRSAMREPVEQPLQDIGGGDPVDDRGAPAAR